MYLPVCLRAISAGAEFNHVRIVEKIIKNSCFFFCLRADDLLNLRLEEEVVAVKSIENIRYNNALMVRLSIAGPAPHLWDFGCLTH